MRHLILLFMAACPAWNTTWTVCASGCDYSNLQTAFDAAARGDILELKAGEVFEGRFVLPKKQGAGYITIRGSRWKELPPQGTRISVSDAALMPKIQPPNPFDATLTTATYEQYVSSVDTGGDYIDFGGGHGFSNGDPVACWNDSGSIPITANQIYYVRDVTATAIRVAATPTAAAVDLTTGSTATRFRCSPIREISYWRFTGIEIRKKPGQTSEYNLIEIGTNQETARAGIPHHIEFDRMYIHGIEGENGPRACIFLNSANFSLTDSRVDHCNKEGEEGKAVAGAQAPGPILIRNNYLSGGSITMLFGGDYVRIYGLVNGDSGGIHVENNHFTRLLAVKYTAGIGGSGNPSGGCSDGGWYINTTTGNWFQCNGGTWTAGPSCAPGEYFRRNDVSQSCTSGACWQCTGSGVFAASNVYRGSNYYTKNLFEMKSVMNMVVTGNVFENNWSNADQSGMAVVVTSQVEQGNANPWARGENIRFESNLIRNSTQGIRVTSQGAQYFGFRNNRIEVRNNLIYKIGNTDYPSINANDSNPMSFAGPCDDCVFEHNTVVSNTTGGPGLRYDTNPLVRWRFANNIGYANAYGMFGDGGNLMYYIQPGDTKHSVLVTNATSGPNSTLPGSPINGLYIPSSVTLFANAAARNYRLSPSSPFSAACTSNCEFKASDNKDLGADVDLVEAATAGAASGTQDAYGSLRLRVDAGSVFAVVRYQAPSSAACSLSLFTDAGRTQLHADTGSGGNQADTRAGNIVDSRRREFILGAVSTLTPSTEYYALLDCGSLRAPFVVRTRPSGGSAEHEVRLTQAQTAAYAGNSSLSGAANLPAAIRHRIPVAPSSVVYLQIGGQPVTAITGR